MIAKVLPRRGPAGQTRSSARRLMRYLLGPGDLPAAESREESSASSATRTRSRGWWPAGIEPRGGLGACVPRSGLDPPADAWAHLATLARGVADCCAEDLDQVRGGLKRNAVWHTVMAADPETGCSPTTQWQQVAPMLMHETGLHPLGSDNPVRWAGGATRQQRRGRGPHPRHGGAGTRGRQQAARCTTTRWVPSAPPAGRRPRSGWFPGGPARPPPSRVRGRSGPTRHRGAVSRPPRPSGAAVPEARGDVGRRCGSGFAGRARNGPGPGRVERGRGAVRGGAGGLDRPPGRAVAGAGLPGPAAPLGA